MNFVIVLVIAILTSFLPRMTSDKWGPPDAIESRPISPTNSAQMQFHLRVGSSARSNAIWDARWDPVGWWSITYSRDEGPTHSSYLPSMCGKYWGNSVICRLSEVKTLEFNLNSNSIQISFNLKTITCCLTFCAFFFLLEQCKVLIHLGDDFFFFSIDKFTTLEWKKPVVTNSRHKTQRAYQHIYINFYDFAVPHMIWFWLHLQWSDAELMRQFPRFASLFQCKLMAKMSDKTSENRWPLGSPSGLIFCMRRSRTF